MQTNNDISLWLGIISKNPLKLQLEVLPMEQTHCPGPLPTWDSKLLSLDTFSTLFKAGCWSTQFGDVCAVTLLYCFYFSFLLKIVY